MTPEIRPASDDQVLAWKELGANGVLKFVPSSIIDSLVARIEADRAELATAREQIRAKDEEIARLRGIVVAVAQGRPEGAAYSAHFVEDARAALSKPEPGR